MQVLGPGIEPAEFMALQYEIGSVPLEKVPDNSGKARGKDTQEGWINGLRMARLYGPGYPKLLDNYPNIRGVVSLLQVRQGLPMHQVMVNELAANSALEKHRDGPPEMQRWHLPIFTNPLVEWWDEIDGWVNMELGVWYGPVNYCGILHSMHNDGPTNRIHLVVDLSP